MDLLLFFIIFFVLAGMCLILERSKPNLSLASKKNLTRQTNSLGNQTISFPGGGTIVIPPLSHERKNIPRSIFSKRRKVRTRSPTEVDGNYIPVIMDLLAEYFASYSQAVKVRVLENQVRILLQTILKWLCERNNLEVNTEFSLSQLLGHLYPFEKGIMQQWYAPLREWCDKFYSADEFHKHLTLNDAMEFGKFLLPFLHNIKNNSDLLMARLDEKYPIRAPSPERETLAPPKAPEPKNPPTQHQIPSPIPPLSNTPKTQPPNNNINKKPPLISDKSKNAVYCPQCNALIPPSKTGRVRCPQCSFCPSAIDLGYLLDEYGTVIDHFSYPLEVQRTHTAIVGASGWGKTTAAMGIARGNQERGVGTLIFQCGGHDFRRLKNMQVRTQKGIKEVLYFSPGDENRNIRFNPLAIPQFNGKFASVTNHIDYFVVTFIFGYDLEEPFPSILGEATRLIYREKGWDLTRNEPPQGIEDIFPQPIELFSAVERVLKARYDTQTRENLKHVLWTRLTNFNRGDLGKMFNYKRSLSFEELLTKCVVFELEHLEDTTKLLFTFLFLTSFFEYLRLRGERPQLNHVVIIEESQKVLSKEIGPHYGTVMKFQTIKIITDALLEFRKLGEGVVIITQDPNRLDSEIFTNSQTGIVFMLKDIDCVETICNRFTKLRAKKDQIPNLKRGEGFVIVPGYLEAMRVKFFDFSEKGAVFSDEDIATFMHETYYKENPWALEAMDVDKKIAEIYGESMGYEVKNSKDLYMGIKMEGVDKTAALIEYSHLILNQDPNNPFLLQGKRYPLNKCFKEVADTKFRTPSIQQEIAKIQTNFDEIKDFKNETCDIHSQFFTQIMNLAMKDVPKPVPLPAVTYFLRLLVFKYLKFTPPSKCATVYRLLIQLLAQNGFNLRS